MSLSPARQHRLRVQAEQAAREGGSVRHASGYDLMLLQLAEDRRRLKGVQSTVKKAEIKVELLPKYAAWAEGVLAAGGAQQDDVLMYVMLWRIDAGDYAGALEIGRHALRHGWVMPLGNRNVQTVLAEEMADAAQSAMLAATGFDADLLLQTLELTDGLDMPDQSRARLHKAIGAVWTDGIGNTSGVIPGKTITERQAAEGLISNVLRVERALERCVKQQPPQKVYDATVSFAFNVGTGNACSSTLVKLLNQRRWADACRQLPRWVYVKGVFNQGLDNRRAQEMAWCLKGAGL